jgi:WD40 repeat protein
MLGAAAQKLNPDAMTRHQLTGALTATHYAGTLPNVLKAEYGPDGVLATLGSDRRFALWDTANPRKPVRLATLAGTGAVSSDLRFSRDGRTLAGVDADGKAVLWDVANPSRPARLATLPNDSRVSAIAFGGNGNIFVAGESSGATTVWDTTDRARPVLLSKPLGPGRHAVERLAISPNGRMLIVDQLRFIPVFDLSDPADPVSDEGVAGFGAAPMAFSPDGSMLAFGYPGEVQVYDMTKRSSAGPRLAKQPPPPLPPPPPPMLPDEDEDGGVQPPPPLPDDDEDIDDLPTSLKGALSGITTSLTYSPDGSLLIAGDSNGMTQMWDLSASANRRTLTGVRSRSPIRSLSFDRRAGALVTTDATATATLWQVAAPGAPAPLAEVTVPDDAAAVTAFRPDGRSLVVAGMSGTARTWTVTDPARPVRGAGLTLHTGPVRSVAISADHRTIAAVARDTGALTVADAGQPARKTTLTTLTAPEDGTNVLALSPDGQTLAVGVDGGTVQLWNVADRARPVLLSRLAGAGQAREMVFSPDGRTLATVNMADTTIALWNVANRPAPARLATLTGHSDIVGSLAFSPNGRYLVSGSFDRTAVLWDTTDRARPFRLTTLTGHTEWLRAVTFSPDGRTLATSAGDDTVILWDATSPASPIRLAAVRTASSGSSVAFRPDGRTLAITTEPGDEDVNVSLWTYHALNGVRADPARTACIIAGRGLNAVEWARYIPEVPYRRTCAG